jgi:hypothetical protein
MHGNIQRRVDEARKIERHIRQGTDKIVSAGKFAVVAKALWPINTAACIASIAKKDERTGARWLSGEFEPPGIVLAAILTKSPARLSAGRSSLPVM